MVRKAVKIEDTLVKIQKWALHNMFLSQQREIINEYAANKHSTYLNAGIAKVRFTSPYITLYPSPPLL